jgi:hypothetical protein
MHRAPLSRTQRRSRCWHLRTRSLEDGLPWNRAAWRWTCSLRCCRTRSSTRLRCRCSSALRRLIHRTRSGLWRNQTARRRRWRWHRCPLLNRRRRSNTSRRGRRRCSYCSRRRRGSWRCSRGWRRRNSLWSCRSLRRRYRRGRSGCWRRNWRFGRRRHGCHSTRTRRGLRRLPDGLKHIAGLRDSREINLRLDLIGSRSAGTRLLGRCSGAISLTLEVPPYLFGRIWLNGARVALLVSYADRRQEVENRFALYFQLSGQIVNANFVH